MKNYILSISIFLFLLTTDAFVQSKERIPFHTIFSADKPTDGVYNINDVDVSAKSDYIYEMKGEETYKGDPASKKILRISDIEIEVLGNMVLENVILEMNLTGVGKDSIFMISESGSLTIKDAIIVTYGLSNQSFSSFIKVNGMIFINDTIIKNREESNKTSVIKCSSQSSTFLYKITYQESSAPLVYSEGRVMLNNSNFTENENYMPVISIMNNEFNSSPSLIIDNIIVNSSKMNLFILADNVNEIIVKRVNFFHNKGFADGPGGAFIRVKNFNLTHLVSCNFFSSCLSNVALIETRLRSSGENEQLPYFRSGTGSRAVGGFHKMIPFTGSVVIDSTIFDENAININSNNDNNKNNNNNNKNFNRNVYNYNDLDDDNLIHFYSLIRVMGKSSLLVRETNFFNNMLSSDIQISNQENALCISTDERTESSYIEDSLFINNTALHAVSGVLLCSKSCSLVSSRFQNNKATTFKEHYHKTSQTSFSCGYIHLNKVYFIGNEAVLGSTLYLKRSLEQRFDITSSSLIIESSIFSKNFAESGQITANSPKPLSITINNCRVTENQVVSRGGFLDIMTSNERIHMFLTGSIFFDNVAEEGGVFFFGNVMSGVVTISGCDFKNNKATGNIGAGGVLSTSIIFDFNLIFRNCMFNQNSAQIKGGVFLISGGTITVADSNFYNNNALSEGSIITIESSATVQFMNCSIEGGNKTLFKIHDNEMNQMSIEGLTIKDFASLHDSIFKIEYIRLNLDHIILENIVAKNFIDITSSRSVNLSQVSLSNTKFEDFIKLKDSKNVIISNVSVTKATMYFLHSESSESKISMIILNFYLCPTERHSEDYMTGRYGSVRGSGCLIKASGGGSVHLSNSQFFHQMNHDKQYFIFTDEDTALVLNKVHLLSSSNIIHGHRNKISIYETKFEKCEKALNMTAVEKILIQSCEVDQTTEFLFCLDCVNVDIYSSEFKHSAAVISILGSQNRQIITNTNIISSRFEKNSNYKNDICLLNNKKNCNGGAASISSSGVVIRDSKFIHNSALHFGGALFLSLNQESNNSELKWDLINNYFYSNSAEEAGGAIFLNKYNLTKNENNKFNENNAPVGRDITTDKIKMVLEDDLIMNNIDTSNIFNNLFKPKIFKKSDDLFQISDIGPGQRLSFPLIASFRDINGDVVRMNPAAELSLIKESDQLDIKHDKELIFINDNETNIFSLEGLTFFADQESSHKVSVNLNRDGDIRRRYSYKPIEEPASIYTVSNDKPINIILHFRNCIKGEIKHHKECKPCPLGTYSLNTGDVTCKSCPFAVICSGGDRFVLKEGYWRENENSERIFACKFPTACLGHSAVGDASCKIGYLGPSCEFCDVESDYYQFNSLECKNCKESTLLIDLIKMIFFVLLFFALTIFMLKLTNGTVTSNIYLVCLKINVNFFQALMLLLSIDVNIVSAELPNPFASSARIFTNWGSLLSPLSCLTIFNKILGKEETFIAAFIINILFFSGFLIIILRDKFCRNPFSQSDFLTKFFLIFYFTSHTISLSTYFRYFQCYESKFSKPYISYGSYHDYCRSDSYYKLIYFSLPLIITIILIIPYLIVKKVFIGQPSTIYNYDLESRSDDKISKFKRHRLVFLFFTLDYKTEFNYWCFIHLLDGFLVILVWYNLVEPTRDLYLASFFLMVYIVSTIFEANEDIYVEEKLGKLKLLQKKVLIGYSLYLIIAFASTNAFWLPLGLILCTSYMISLYVKGMIMLVYKTIKRM